jgi:septal ring factor EnvC (AmiA/AmiB activator)
MQNQLIILFFLTTFSFSITIEEAMMIEYGSYISASALFIVLLLAFLLYWTFHYKKSVKKLELELTQREETLSTLNSTIQNSELERIKDEHKFEKQIVELNQDIKALEDDLKKGLKSQVVSKIDEYESKRRKHLNRVDIES